MAIKYTSLFQLQHPPNLPKLGFLFENIPFGNLSPAIAFGFKINKRRNYVRDSVI
jgi:hypothetical protein